MVRMPAMLVLLITAGGVVPHPASAVTNGAIGFVQLASPGDYVVGTIDPDGSHARQRAEGTSPAWSPDGSLMASISSGGPLQEQVTIRGSGSRIATHVLAQGYDLGTGSGMDWSPDGTRIAYTYQQQIWVMNATAPYDPERLSPAGCLGAWPSWSPDSSMVAYRGSECMDTGLYIINADGTDNHLIPNPPGVALVNGLDWSPDGSQFAFMGASTDGSGLWLMDSDGGNAHLLVESVEVLAPNWSPDGTQIVFLGNEGISTVYVDGTSYTVLRSGPLVQPKWRPSP